MLPAASRTSLKTTSTHSPAVNAARASAAFAASTTVKPESRRYSAVVSRNKVSSSTSKTTGRWALLFLLASFALATMINNTPALFDGSETRASRSAAGVRVLSLSARKAYYYGKRASADFARLLGLSPAASLRRLQLGSLLAMNWRVPLDVFNINAILWNFRFGIIPLTRASRG